MSETLSMAAFDRPAKRPASSRSRPVDGTLDGVRLPRPVISTNLPLTSGLTRHVVLLRHPAAKVAKERLSLTIGGMPAAFLEPSWLQSPLREPIDLVTGMTAEGASRLLRLVLSTIPSLFGQGLDRDFPKTARTLVGLLHLPQGLLGSRCAIGSAGEVLSYRLPVSVPALPGSLVAVSEDRIDCLSQTGMMLEDGNLLHVFQRDASPVPPDFTVLGDAPMVLCCPDRLPDQQPFLPWLARRGDGVRQWGEDLLRRHSCTDQTTAALLREHVLGAERLPSATIHCLAATQGGVLVWLDVDDPHRLVAALRIEAETEHADIDVPASGRVRAHLRFKTKGEVKVTFRLRFVFGSGRISTFREGPLDPFNGTLPKGSPMDAPVEAGRALMSAWGKRIVSLPRPQLEDFGTRSPNLRLSVVVATGPVPDLVRARASLVACEAERGDIEIVYAIAGMASGALQRLLHETAEVYGVSHRLVSLPAEITAPDLLLAGLESARAPATLVMGREVLPQGPGWAGRWIATLSRTGGPALIAGTLLATDGSIQHAGGHFSWTGRSAPAVPALRAVGLPACDLGSDTELASTEVLCADAVGLTNAARKAVLREGAKCADPATMLQITALRLGASMDPLGRLVRYAAAPETNAAIEASGRWHMSALLAAADGVAPR